MELIKDKTREELLEILSEEYPNEDKNTLNKMIDKIVMLSLNLVNRYFKKK